MTPDTHVRLYRHELECAAYRSLSTDARALLIEFRSLYNPREGNCVFLSVRDMQRRLNVGQRRAQRARDELLDRGFIRMLKPGGFTRKTKHAAEFAITNEPLNPHQDGATAPKDFMKWMPQKKSSVAVATTDGSRSDYVSTPRAPQNPPLRSRSDYVNDETLPDYVADTATQIGYQGDPLFWGAMKTSGRLQLACLWSVLALSQPEQAAA